MFYRWLTAVLPVTGIISWSVSWIMQSWQFILFFSVCFFCESFNYLHNFMTRDQPNSAYFIYGVHCAKNITPRRCRSPQTPPPRPSPPPCLSPPPPPGCLPGVSRCSRRTIMSQQTPRHQSMATTASVSQRVGGDDNASAATLATLASRPERRFRRRPRRSAISALPAPGQTGATSRIIV